MFVGTGPRILRRLRLRRTWPDGTCTQYDLGVFACCTTLPGTRPLGVSTQTWVSSGNIGRTRVRCLLLKSLFCPCFSFLSSSLNSFVCPIRNEKFLHLRHICPDPSPHQKLCWTQAVRRQWGSSRAQQSLL